MEVLFILVVLAVIVGAVGAIVLGSASALRRRKLGSDRDKLAEPTAHAHDRSEQARPEHVAVDTEQRARFVGSR